MQPTGYRSGNVEGTGKLAFIDVDLKHSQLLFEKSPEYKLTAATPLFDFDPEKEHNFKMGNIDGKVFVLVFVWKSAIRILWMLENTAKSALKPIPAGGSLRI